MTAKATWKNLEKKIAERLGIERVSRAGAGEACEDVHGQVKLRGGVIEISGECKLRARLPALLSNALEQAKRNASEKAIPVVFVKGKGEAYDETIVGMRLKDFERLLK